MSFEPHNASNPRMAAIVERVAAHPAIEQAVISAIRAQLPAVIEAVTRDLYGGGRLRMYVAKSGGGRRQDRCDRIRQLLDMGYPPKAVAAQVGCSERTVFRVMASDPEKPVSTPNN